LDGDLCWGWGAGPVGGILHLPGGRLGAGAPNAKPKRKKTSKQGLAGTTTCCFPRRDSGRRRRGAKKGLGLISVTRNKTSAGGGPGRPGRGPAEEIKRGKGAAKGRTGRAKRGRRFRGAVLGRQRWDCRPTHPGEGGGWGRGIKGKSDRRQPKVGGVGGTCFQTTKVDHPAKGQKGEKKHGKELPRLGQNNPDSLRLFVFVRPGVWKLTGDNR